MSGQGADPYVKIWLIQNGRRVEKRKTVVLKNTQNPEFNETITFEVGSDQVSSTSLTLHVMDYDRIGRNDEIGRIVLGSKGGPNEVKHWNEMLAQTETEIEMWHVLRKQD